MRLGGEDLLKQFNRGMDYAQNSFNSSQGIGVDHSSLIYKGIVIEVDFTIYKSVTSSSVQPPFSVYAKIIGLDDSTAFPEREIDKIYYPPFFPMHNICIPEIGEEVLIMKEEPNPAAAGYYVGRVNDSSSLNISYARDFVGIEDSETNNVYKYGFNFDVRRLRNRYRDFMPSDETLNMSIPITFGDVVQQGRSKTYSRHSFNRNNKKGVLEQGIRLEGQESPNNNTINNFAYLVPGDNTQVSDKPTQIETYITDDESVEGGGDDTLKSTQFSSKVVVNDPNFLLPQDVVNNISYDPSIGETSTKTIHFIDSSIKRLGNYSLQSVSNSKEEAQNNLNGEDKSIIANIADEIYNISSKETNGLLYRQVLGEKLVTQQRENYNLMREVLTTLEGFADSTQVLLNAFLDHTHALPKIELNLEKEIKVKQVVNVPARYRPQPNRTITTQGRYVGGGRRRIRTGVRKVTVKESRADWLNRTGGRSAQLETTRYVPKYSTVTIPRTWVPGTSISVPQPPRLVRRAFKYTRNRKQKVNFDAIIGGADNPRFTAPIETDSGDPQNPAPLGQQTEIVNTGLQEAVDSFTNQKIKLAQITQRVSKFLSNNQFIN
tara:strand:+ start:2536 stop:4344 length:1809 start_codon:yes stop_codon:yes gene_type:complete